MPLFWKIFVSNGVVFLIATSVILVAPVQVSQRPLTSEIVVLAIGLGLMLVVDAILLRFSVSPVDRALEELRSQQRAANARALAAQEAERHRIAADLHDEVGQSLTVVLLGLKSLEARVSPEIAEELALIRETARDGLDDVRRVAARLRPGVLEDLGLHSALSSVCTDVAATTGLEVVRRFGRGLGPLTSEQELVIYRVAQEALTNVARHARATSVTVALGRVGPHVVLEVTDDGIATRPPSAGIGISGMYERALLIGASVAVEPRPGHGLNVRLEVPV
jgi:two-component system, NarL family, sensor histidine kinase UhpB